MKTAPVSPKSLFWFRKGLRLHDNPSLWAAIKDAKNLYPVFVLDPWFLKPEVVGVNRLNFLLQSLTGASLNDPSDLEHFADYREAMSTDSVLASHRHHSLYCADLRSSLKARGSNLLVLRGNPQEVLPRVCKDWQITRLCFEVDTEDYAKERDAKVTAAAKKAGAARALTAHVLKLCQN